MHCSMQQQSHYHPFSTGELNNILTAFVVTIFGGTLLKETVRFMLERMQDTEIPKKRCCTESCTQRDEEEDQE